MGGFEKQCAEIIYLLCKSNSLTFSSLLHPCLFVYTRTCHRRGPRGTFNELLLFRHSVLQDSNRDGGGVVLVLRQSNAGDPLSGLLVAVSSPRFNRGKLYSNYSRSRSNSSLRYLFYYITR